MHTLDNIAVKRPFSKIYRKKQNLCLDKGYDFQEIENKLSRKDIYHIFDIEENNQ